MAGCGGVSSESSSLPYCMHRPAVCTFGFALGCGRGEGAEGSGVACTSIISRLTERRGLVKAQDMTAV